MSIPLYSRHEPGLGPVGNSEGTDETGLTVGFVGVDVGRVGELLTGFKVGANDTVGFAVDGTDVGIVGIEVGLIEGVGVTLKADSFDKATFDTKIKFPTTTGALTEAIPPGPYRCIKIAPVLTSIR